jgi:crotonobetainyl-CoA:carnitine CoA-transferase CaiB-like acyl-CoA transferase
MNSSEPMLKGIRVIDLTTVLAGPATTLVLADLGAEVIKIEPPFGDETRRMGRPAYHDGSAGSFVSVNRNKKCMSVDLSRPEGKDILLKLLEDADVLVENFKPGTLTKWGLDYDTVLHDRFPRLVYCQINAFGNDGPLGGLGGYDPVMQAYCGIMSLNGHKDGPPLRVNMPAIDWVAGLYGAVGIEAALLERERSGKGQAVRTTLYEAALSLLHPFATNWLLNGVVAQRMGNRHTSSSPYDIFPTMDGHVLILTNNLRQFKALCEVMGLDEWKDDPRFQTTSGRIENEDYIFDKLAKLFARVAASEIVPRLQAAGVPAGPVLNIGEALSHPQAIARGVVLEGENGYRSVASPMRFSRTPIELRSVPAVHGQHSRELMKKAGYSPEAIEKLIADGVLVASDA